MATLYIICEGSTEEKVLKEFLKHYWSKRFDSAEMVNMAGRGNLMRKFASSTTTYLKNFPGSQVVCLVDYREHPFPVGNSGDAGEDFNAIKRYMEQQVPEPYRARFASFPVIHEVET